MAEIEVMAGVEEVRGVWRTMQGWAIDHIVAVEAGVEAVEEAEEEVEIRVIEVGDSELEEEEEVVVVGPVRYRRSASSPPVPSESYSHLYWCWSIHDALQTPEGTAYYDEKFFEDPWAKIKRVT
jgi:hypothetical protein